MRMWYRLCEFAWSGLETGVYHLWRLFGREQAPSWLCRLNASMFRQYCHQVYNRLEFKRGEQEA